MGCNSHTYIEYRRKGAKDGDKWIPLLWSEVDRRNYALYAKMAGVCNYGNRIEPIAPPHSRVKAYNGLPGRLRSGRHAGRQKEVYRQCR